MTHLSDGRLDELAKYLTERARFAFDSGFRHDADELRAVVEVVELVRVQREALRAADAMRERIRKEDGGADDWGRWFECAAYDDARAAVGVSGEPTP